MWLPLPHLIEILPIQSIWFYRTGAFASLVSIGSGHHDVRGGAPYSARDRIASWAAVCTALLVLNPNLLYLHTTPMTEPLLLASSMLVVLWLFEWVEDDRDTVPSKLAGALCRAWTRYEHGRHWCRAGSGRLRHVAPSSGTRPGCDGCPALGSGPHWPLPSCRQQPHHRLLLVVTTVLRPDPLMRVNR